MFPWIGWSIGFKKNPEKKTSMAKCEQAEELPIMGKKLLLWCCNFQSQGISLEIFETGLPKYQIWGNL